VDDLIADGNTTTQVTLTVVEALSDPVFGAVPDQIVLVTTVDDEIAGFTVQETGGRTVVREGRRDELRVVLDVQPVSSVVIRITSADPDYVGVSPTTLTFTPENWAKSQTVSVVGLENDDSEDDDFDGLRLIDVILAVDAALSDDAFDSVPDQVIQVRFLD
jgi:large repetitive protein